MSNPGPASTVTPHYLLDGGSTDGVKIGLPGEPVGLYGVTPVAQAAAITALSNTATGTEIATAVNAIITALKNVGITA